MVAADMSDNWDFYLSEIEGAPASFFVDLDLVNDAPIADLPYLWTVRITLRDPQPDGLSGSEETPTLNQIEDALGETLEHTEPPAVAAGRATWAGHRDHLFYVPSADGAEERMKAIHQAFPDYEMHSGVFEDAEWDSYLNFLFPTAEQLHSIENRRVCDLLQEHGDALDMPREIDHWIGFAAAEQREQFQERAAELGFYTRELIEPDDQANPVYVIQIYRIDVPASDTIDNVTLPLFHLALESGGHYDGWESEALQ